MGNQISTEDDTTNSWRTTVLFDEKILNEMSNDTDKFWGRVICINPNSNPLEKARSKLEYLSDIDQLFPFVMGPEDIKTLHGKKHKEFLLSIGYTEDWLNKKHARGLVFYFVVFRDSVCIDELKINPWPGTWEGVFSLIQYHSEECAKKLKPHWEEIKDVECKQDGPIDIVNPADHKTISSFEEFAKHDVLCDPIIGRRFLRHTIKCTYLYRGDGYTYNEKGERGIKEYLFKRVSLDELKGKNNNGIVLCQKLNW